MADDESKLEFLADLDTMFDSPTHSDLSIVVDSYTFKAHKVILGMRTQFFTNATNPQSGFSEAKDGVVTIKEHGIPAVWCFLKYCYTGNYSSGPNIIGLGNEELSLLHPHVYALADMLDIPKLKALVTKQLQTELDANWEAGKFSVVVAEVFDITASRDKGIRDVVILAAKKHLAELLPLEQFGEVMDKYGEFSAGLVRVMSTAIHTECKCTSCGQKYRHYCDYCI